MSFLGGWVTHQALKQAERRQCLSQDHGGFLVVKNRSSCAMLIACSKVARWGFCWNTPSILAASASPGPWMRVASAVALAIKSAACRVGGGFDRGRLGVAFGIGLGDVLVALGLHAVEDGGHDAFRQADLFDAQKLEADAVIIGDQLRLDRRLNFLFDFVEFEPGRVRVHEVGEVMSGPCFPAWRCGAWFRAWLGRPGRNRRGISGKRPWRRRSASRHRRWPARSSCRPGRFR